MTLTHVTEWGLGLCALIGAGIGAPKHQALTAAGLRPDVRACGDKGDPHDGSNGRARYIGVDQCGDTVLTIHTPRTVPTCPVCAVMRDAALEGRLPERRP